MLFSHDENVEMLSHVPHHMVVHYSTAVADHILCCPGGVSPALLTFPRDALTNAQKGALLFVSMY